MSMTTPTPGQPLSEADVKRIFGLDPNATGNRPRGWRIVDEGESNDIRAFSGMDVPPGSLAVSTRDGASNPISPTACQYPNFIGTVEDDYDRTYRDYFYRPHAPVSRPGDGVEGGGEAVEQACGLTVQDAISQSAEALSILRALPKSQSLFVWADGSYRIAPTLDVAIARQEEGSLVAVIPMSDLSDALTPPAEPVSRPAGEGEREAVARIIDPRIVGMDFSNYTPDSWMGQAITKADAIISLLRPAAPDAGGGEDLAGKLKAIRDKFLFPTPDKDHTDYAVMTRCIAALQPGGER